MLVILIYKSQKFRLSTVFNQYTYLERVLLLEKCFHNNNRIR